MFHVVLYEPEIPPNTGNIIRLCANTGAQLHVVHPLGFDLDHGKLKRAGLDYREFIEVQEHDSLACFLESVKPKRLFALSTHGKRFCHEAKFQVGDAFLFGPETRGLPKDLLASLDADFVLRIPLLPVNRSLNLSNAVAIVVYEAWRQEDFAGSV